MKTTIDIAEPLLREARKVARTDRTTLRALVEEGLRGVLEVRGKSASFGFAARASGAAACSGSSPERPGSNFAMSPTPAGARDRPLHEFLAIVTHPRIYDPPTPLSRALDQVKAWLGSPSLTLLSEGAGYWADLEAALKASRSAGPQVHDARIAALCLHHQVAEIWTADRNFGRYPALKVRNPLVR